MFAKIIGIVTTLITLLVSAEHLANLQKIGDVEELPEGTVTIHGMRIRVVLKLVRE